MRAVSVSEVLEVAVSCGLVQQWRRWLAPEVQPFIVDETLRAGLEVGDGVEVPLEWSCRTRFCFMGTPLTGSSVCRAHSSLLRQLDQTFRAALARHQVVAGRWLVPTLASVEPDQRGALNGGRRWLSVRVVGLTRLVTTVMSRCGGL